MEICTHSNLNAMASEVCKEGNINLESPLSEAEFNTLIDNLFYKLNLLHVWSVDSEYYSADPSCIYIEQE